MNIATPDTPPQAELESNEPGLNRGICIRRFVIVGLIPALTAIFLFAGSSIVGAWVVAWRVAYMFGPMILIGGIIGWAIAPKLVTPKYSPTLKWHLLFGAVWGVGSVAWGTVVVFFADKSPAYNWKEGLHDFSIGFIVLELLCIFLALIAGGLSRSALLKEKQQMKINRLARIVGVRD